jgi:threonine dehydrogenase-like Zn-dependent dehydrogenase
MVPKPIVTHACDVIVKITACSICSGSDLHLYNGEIPSLDQGSVLGHEAMGEVVEKGENVQLLEIGDRVVIAFDIACGQCDNCCRQEFTGCRETNDSRLAEKMLGHAPSAMFGYSRLMGNVPGSQAEFVRVPFADTNCYKVPSNVPDEKALYMSDVACTSYHAVDMGEVKDGDTVVIWGLGPIGLCAARWAQIRGARRVIGIDMVKERLELAENYLKIEVINRSVLSSSELVDTLNSVVPGGADCCIEAVGFRFPMSLLHQAQRAIGLETDTPEILSECFQVARPFGRVSVIGDYVGYANNFPIGMIALKHLTIKTGQVRFVFCFVFSSFVLNLFSVLCQKYFDYVMEKIQDGTFDPSFIITHRVTLQGVPLAYSKLDTKSDGYIKVFVSP